MPALVQRSACVPRLRAWGQRDTLSTTTTDRQCVDVAVCSSGDQCQTIPLAIPPSHKSDQQCSTLTACALGAKYEATAGIDAAFFSVRQPNTNITDSEGKGLALFVFGRTAV